ncbi:MAG: RsmE family RNA methyltransferase [bacterium]|nr:RsmE family RNA methyltransferase [bacterium]
MKLHRFFIKESFAQNPVHIADAALARQLRSVLRLKAGDRIVLCDGRGQEADATIQVLDAKGAEVSIGTPRRNMNEPSRRVILYCALLKRENFEWVAQKAVETGVAEIVPIITSRTVKQGIKSDRITTIIKEAAEQAGRGVLPSFGQALSLTEAFKAAKTSNHINLFCDLHGKGFGELLSGRANVLPNDPKVGVFIGPEGGWHEDEVAEAFTHDLLVANLGKLTLRAETAAVVASYLAINA